jgi:hypothetical protein
VRDAGIFWARSTLAAIEAGERAVTLQELAKLSVFRHKALETWFAGEPDELIDLDGTHAPRKGLVSLVNGARFDEMGSSAERLRRSEGLDGRDWSPIVDAQIRGIEEAFDTAHKAMQRWWPRGPKDSVADVILAARGDAEMKAARRLGISSIEVSALAHRLWGRGLSEEREARLAPTTDSASRATQAQRGWVTRTLLAELEEHINRKGS